MGYLWNNTQLSRVQVLIQVCETTKLKLITVAEDGQLVWPAPLAALQCTPIPQENLHPSSPIVRYIDEHLPAHSRSSSILIT